MKKILKFEDFKSVPFTNNKKNKYQEKEWSYNINNDSNLNDPYHEEIDDDIDHNEIKIGDEVVYISPKGTKSFSDLEDEEGEIIEIGKKDALVHFYFNDKEIWCNKSYLKNANDYISENDRDNYCDMCGSYVPKEFLINGLCDICIKYPD